MPEELTREDITRLLDERDAAKDKEMDTMRERLAEAEKRAADAEARAATVVSASPLTLVPEHGAGPGLEVAETWSQYEQDAIRAGQ